MMNVLSTLFFILLVQGRVVCDSELFPVSLFKDVTDKEPEWSSDYKDVTEFPVGKSVTSSPAATQLPQWIKTDIVEKYRFTKHLQRDEWTEQPTFDLNSLKSKEFQQTATQAMEFFNQPNNNDWESSKASRSCIDLLYMTATRYLLVTYILYTESTKSRIEFNPCKDYKDKAGKLKFEIPASGVCYPKPYGSATCTSDYDVGLIGKDSGFLTKRFNEYFQTTFGKPSELVFDTNVYAFTLEFAMPFIFGGLPTVVIQGVSTAFADLVTQKEQTVNFKMQELASAYYKVFKYNEDFFRILTGEALNVMGQTFKDSLKFWLTTFSNLNNQDQMRIEGKSLKDFRQAHNEKYQSLVEQMSNNGGYNADNLGTLAAALIYAAEAYHTRGAIRHVVGGMQLRAIGRLVQYNNPLSTNDLWVSMIENWGESNKEYNHYKEAPLTKCFLKMSKYLSRMFNAMRLLRTRVKPDEKFPLLNFGDPKDTEYAAQLWLRYKKAGKTEIPEDDKWIRLFLKKFKCEMAAETEDLRTIKLSSECLGKMNAAVNAYNVKLAALATDVKPAWKI